MAGERSGAEACEGARVPFREGRYAAIDIGTVTCRMLVADVRALPDGALSVEPVAKEYAVTNLGEGVDATRRLAPAALARVAEAVDAFVAQLARLDTAENPVLGTTVMATSASRDAENADEFAALLCARGLSLQVISGATEAAMSFAGASAAYAGEPVAVVDVGGGSTEVSLGIGGEVPAWSHSFDVGCRRVTERFWDGYPPSAAALQAARSWVRDQLQGCDSGSDPCHTVPKANRSWKQPARRDEGQTPVTSDPACDKGQTPVTSDPAVTSFRMLAVAGTATSAVSIREAMEVYDPVRVDGATVTAAGLRAIADDLAAKTLPELQRVTGLDPRRAPVIVAGMVILEEAMAALGAPSFTASESDILEGMIMYNARAADACASASNAARAAGTMFDNPQ